MATTTNDKLPDPTQPIDLSTLSGATVPFTLPPAPTSPSYDIAGLPSITALSNPAPTATENQQTDLEGKLLADTRTMGGKAGAQVQAETAAGLPGFQKQLTDVNGQIQALQKEAASIPLELQQQSEGRGITAVGLAPIQAGELRKNAIKALGLSAIAQTLQGNVALAQDQANKAIELQFAPVQAEIDYLKTALQLNGDKLTREDKKRADQLTIQLNERQRVLDEQKAGRDGANKIAMIAAQFGAPSSVLNQLLTAPDMATAISLAGIYLQDPAAKVALKNAQLDTILKQADIAYRQKQTQLLGEPTAAEAKASASALKEAQSSIPLMQDKIATAKALASDSGLNSRVGTSPVTRGARGLTGIVEGALGGGAAGAGLGAAAGAPFAGIGAIPGAIIGGIGGAIFGATRGLPDSVSGAGQNFAASVHQLTNGLTLDNLISAKARGATFGALSEGELALLASSATKLSDWEIKDDKGNGTGFWNVDEGSFKKELKNIQDLTQRAIIQSGASIYDADEQSLLDQLDNLQGNALVPGASYY